MEDYKLTIISLVLIFILGILATILFNNYTPRFMQGKANISIDINKERIPLEKLSINNSNNRLEIILSNEIKDLPKDRTDWDCLTYALYYNKTLTKDYPELDVRKQDLAGVCKLGFKECGEWEGYPHTYLTVNGYGSECILDQLSYTCINLFGGSNE